MPKILLIRLSSMGDIIHNFPALTELRQHFPEAEVHWVVEEAYLGLAGLHPGIDKIIPFALRRWRKRLWSKDNRAEIRAFRDTIQSAHYDLALDSQGLIKSALVGKLSGAPLAGYSRKTARDPLSSFFYDRPIDVPRLHVIERARQLTGRALGYEPQGLLDYGIVPPAERLPWQPADPYVVCLTATARDAKLWEEERWIALGRWLNAQGLRPVFPWGNEAEKVRSERLAAALDFALVPPRFSLVEAARLLADARLAIGVDTGLMHMAAAVDIPTVGIFCDSTFEHAGATARTFSRNIGGLAQQPPLADVQALVTEALQQPVRAQ
ncbi:lipopolysaccharide heptosyltransferase I [Chitinimonas sp.]|uniref:lipopolysaccharide heptosyltransferase I n=1 Tax=Chitinimonas sp. TaxID=1934313 RepID=UPI002F921723